MMATCESPMFQIYRVKGKKWTLLNESRPVITLASDLSRLSRTSVAMMTLLHEMCHLAVPKRIWHGPKFQKEMLRLAKAGAFKELW